MSVTCKVIELNNNLNNEVQYVKFITNGNVNINLIPTFIPSLGKICSRTILFLDWIEKQSKIIND
jgi:hypothetical protein